MPRKKSASAESPQPNSMAIAACIRALAFTRQSVDVLCKSPQPIGSIDEPSGPGPMPQVASVTLILCALHPRRRSESSKRRMPNISRPAAAGTSSLHEYEYLHTARREREQRTRTQRFGMFRVSRFANKQKQRCARSLARSVAARAAPAPVARSYCCIQYHSWTDGWALLLC